MNRRGFSLLEVLVATVLVAAIVIGIYGTLVFTDVFERRESRLRTDQLNLHLATSRIVQDVQESNADFIRVVPILDRIPPPPPEPPAEPPPDQLQPLVIIPSARRVQPVTQGGIVVSPAGEFLVTPQFGPRWTSVVLITRGWSEVRQGFVLYRVVVGNENDDPPPALYFEEAVPGPFERISDTVVSIPWTDGSRQVDLTLGEPLLDRASDFAFDMPPKSRIARVELFTPLTSEVTKVQTRNGGQLTKQIRTDIPLLSVKDIDKLDDPPPPPPDPVVEDPKPSPPPFVPPVAPEPAPAPAPPPIKPKPEPKPKDDKKDDVPVPVPKPKPDPIIQ